MEYQKNQVLTDMRGAEYKVIKRLEDADTGQDKYVIHNESSGKFYYGTESEVQQFVLGDSDNVSRLTNKL